MSRNTIRLNRPGFLRRRSLRVATEGIGRREFLVGSVTAAAAVSPGMKAAANLMSAAGYRLQVQRNKRGESVSVTVSNAMGDRWRLGVDQFADRPKLFVDKTPEGDRIRLVGARFPGCRLPFDLTASITPQRFGDRIRFQFENSGVSRQTGFQMEARLAKWLEGAKLAISEPIALAPLIECQNFAGPIGLQPQGTGTVCYRSDGSLNIAGEVKILIEGDGYVSKELALFPSSPEDDDLTTSRKKLSTRLNVRKGGEWSGSVSLKTSEGWHVHGDTEAFQELTIQAFEGGVGAMSFKGPSALTVSHGPDLTFPLENHELTKTYGPAPDTLFAADLSRGGVWVHQPGLSVELGTQDQDFIVHTDRKGRLSGQPALQAIQVAPVVEGAMMAAPAHEPLPVSLETSESGIQSVVVPAAFPFDIVRREDMLNLTFFFLNFKLTTASGKATLAPDNSKLDAFVIVIFPPQALAEQTILEDTSDTTDSFKVATPLQTRLANPTKLTFFVPASATPISMSLADVGGLLDWSKWEQYVAPTALSSFDSNSGINLGSQIVPLQIDTGKLPATGLLVPASTDILKKELALPIPANGFSVEKTTTPWQSFSDLASLFKPSPTEPAPIPPKLSSFTSFTGLTFNLSPSSSPQNPSKNISSVPTKRIPIPWYSPYTSIEIPTWLILSPNENAGWAHSLRGEIRAVGANLVYGVLWHTNLSLKSGSNIVETTEDGKWTYLLADKTYRASGPYSQSTPVHPSIRAIDSFDYENGFETLPTVPGASGVGQSPDLTHITRSQLVDAMTLRNATPAQDSPSFEVERLMLSALGAELKGEWNASPNVIAGSNSPTTIRIPGSSSLVSWRHIATLGRDHYVKTARRGFLFPTMHQAVLISISERKFQKGPNENIYAVLRTRQFVVVSQPTVKIDASDQIPLGFQTITCLTKHTPDLDATSDTQSSAWSGSLGKGGFTSPNGIWILVGGAPFAFNMKAIDMDGNPFAWGQPSIFVEWEVGLSLPTDPFSPIDFGTLSDAFNSKNPPGGASKVATGGQHVSLVPSAPAASSGGPALATAHPCDKIQIGAVKGKATVDTSVPGFRPILIEADVHIPAVEQLSGNPAASTVQLARAYTLNGGFGSKNAGQMYFELIASGTGYKAGGGALASVPTNISDVSKAGGILSPSLTVGGLSRLSGAVSWPPKDPAQLLGSTTPPNVDVNQYFAGLNAKILGVVDLSSILPNPIKIGGNGVTSPLLNVTPIYGSGPALPGGTQVPTGAQVNFLWTPSLTSFPGGSNPIFQASRQGPATQWSSTLVNGSYPAKINLTAQFRTDYIPPPAPAVSPYYLVDGRLTDVTLNAIAPITAIIVPFQRLEFKMETGKSSQIYVDTDPIQFAGPLSFVSALQQFLGQGGSGLHMPGTSDQPSDEAPGSSIGFSGNELASTSPSIRPQDDGAVGFSPYFNITASGITAGFTLNVPSIGIGILAICNIGVSGELDLPFLIDPLRVKFSFCTRDNPFALSCYGITGGGFIGITLGLDGLEIFEGSLEFGAMIALDLGVASGSVSLMAGIYFKIESGSTTLTAYIRLNGSVEVICLINISITFYIGLTLQITNGQTELYGTATVSVEVSVLFFSASVSMSVTKTIPGGAIIGNVADSVGPDSLYASLGEAGQGVASEAPPVPFISVVSQPQFEAYWAAFGGN